MTYKEIVDRVKEVANDHFMIADFGYGNLSDIKANDQNNGEADYPYAFLNPTNHTRTGQAVIYRFNLIVMDLVLDTDFLKIQSECQQYIDDILARLRFHYTDQVDLTLNVSLTPFKERFQDEVAGMTATLEIEVPERLNECIAPFTPDTPPTPPVTETLVLTVLTTYQQQEDPDLDQDPIRFPQINLDTYNGWRPDHPFNYYNPTPTEAGNYKFVLTGTAKIDGEYVGPPAIELSGALTEADSTTWPTEAEYVSGQVFQYTATWNSFEYPSGLLLWTFPNDPPPEGTWTTFPGTELNGYRLT